jgi:phosphoribosylamine---glycine ligase
MRVLVIGGGGREHALCLGLARDPSVTEVVAAPGNPGIAAIARTVPLTTPLAVALDVQPDLVVIGPEAPLVAGAADELRAAGFDVFGPAAAAAELEGSKAFAKDVMTAAGVPTAAHHVATTPEELAAALDATGPPYVVKHDELAAGKGVVVTTDRAAALAHGAGHRVVVEEHLDGPEVSLFCLTDGVTVVPLLPAQDFKRVGDGDAGPNTGGMGAYCPLPWLPPDLVDEVVKTIAVPTVEHMAARGTPFSGLLYVGLALTSAGPKVVEFNCRFGDPETQVVLALLDSPLGDVLHAVATGRLADYGSLGSRGPLRWRDGAAVVVVVASEGYPAAPVTGDVIDGIEAAESVPGVSVLHAGTALDADGRLVTAGGRVLGVTAVGADIATARASAYDAVGRLHIRGGHYRADIAAVPA